VAPSFTWNILAGTDDGRVWQYSPLTPGWTNITPGLPQRWVTKVAYDPLDHNTLYVTFSGLRWDEDQGHVFKSTDAGSSWTDITGDLPDSPVNVILIDPENSALVMVGTDVGCYYTLNEGQSWEMLGLGLPHVPVLDLKFHAPTRMLVAGTHGRSMFSLDLPIISNAEGPDSTPGPVAITISNYPNPFNPRTTIAFAMPGEGLALVEILDIRGHLVRTLCNEVLPAGATTLLWDGKDNRAQDSASGVYFARLKLAGQEVHNKMTLVR